MCHPLRDSARGFPKGDFALADAVSPGTCTRNPDCVVSGFAEQASVCKAGWVCLEQSVVSTSLNQAHLFHLCLIDKFGGD